jgi:hypothetical protein
LEWAVWYFIIEAACRKMAHSVPDPKEVYEELPMRSTVFIEKIGAIIGIPSDQYPIVGFYEVGVLDSRHQLFDLDDFRGLVFDLATTSSEVFLNCVGCLIFSPLSLERAKTGTYRVTQDDMKISFKVYASFPA